MALLLDQDLNGTERRNYHVEVPDDPPTATVPAIIVFHGGGQDVTTIAKHWGVEPPNPVPAYLRNYLLVFPETDPSLTDQWVHFAPGDVGFPTHDLAYVERLIAEITTRTYPTGSATQPVVSADPNCLYAAGFSNGGGMVWQLLNSDLSASFQGFAAVGKALDPEKARHYRNELANRGEVPAPAPVVYIQGTADAGYRPPFTLEETPLGETLPFFTVTESLRRNEVPAGAVATTTELVPGSTGVTEVVLQLFGGTEAFLQGTVINGGHNWPTPDTKGNPPVADHFDTTRTVVEFWQRHAGLS
jgi:poly(3-hydroxybutyrate) depolymerase